MNVHIFMHVCEASIRRDSGSFIYMSVMKLDRDRDGRECTLFEQHIILLSLWLYTNKSRPFEVSNDILFLSVQSEMTEYF